MEELLDRAFAALKALPVKDQIFLAWDIIERNEDKTEWDQIVAEPEARAWLVDESQLALKRHEKLTQPISRAYITVDGDNMLREDAYWRHFDDLPDHVQKLAEANYKLWKESPTHPSLRFKKIHPDLPIFSFRIGMKHRAVGVETDDGRVVWFWMGAFQHFKDMIDRLKDAG